MAGKIPKYREFWPHYLNENANPVCRGLHYIGTTLAIASLIALIATDNLWFILTGLVAGYGFAWIGHGFFEHNRPATFTYPFWSLPSDFRMYFLWLAGRLESHRLAAESAAKKG